VSFRLPLGRHFTPGTVRGYYIDLSSKAETPVWPPPWFDAPDEHKSIAVAQWGLGCFERFVAGQGDAWLAAAREAARHLAQTQHRDGKLAGAWLDERPFRHTFRVRTPWASAMGQGEAASLLVRVAAETGEEELVDAARLALGPLAVPTAEGGVAARLDGREFPEEYPTTPASMVLNGALFAFFGCYDVAVALGDADARRRFDEGVETLSRHIERWDTGYWSRYDLYPHPVLNVAAPWYHTLHVDQLRALHTLAPRPELAAARDRWERYGRSPVNRAWALARKVLFRLVVPKR
jgi:hypothetical protein